jgi:hypothetical protein
MTSVSRYYDHLVPSIPSAGITAALGELLPASTAALAAAATALAPYVPVPVRFGEPGIYDRAERGLGVFVPPPVAGDPLAFQAAALAAIVPPPCPRRAEDAAATMAYGDVLVWADARIHGVAGIPPYAQGRFTRILGADVPRQREWVHKHLAAACG